MAIHLRLVHSIPALCCFTNAYISNIRLKLDFWKMISLICFVYAIFLYSFWRQTGRQQYIFLDFNHGKQAFLVLTAINVFATSFYLLFYHLDQKVKNKLSSHYRISANNNEFADEEQGVQLNEYTMVGCYEDENNEDLENLLQIEDTPY